MHLNIKVNPDSNPKGFFKSILIIDDDKAYCDCLGSFVADRFKNMMVVCLYIPKKGLEIMKQMYFDVVICDIKMDEISGDVLIPIIMKMSPSTKIIAMTGWGKHEAFLAGEAKPFRFIVKQNKETDETRCFGSKRIDYSPKKILDSYRIRWPFETGIKKKLAQKCRIKGPLRNLRSNHGVLE